MCIREWVSACVYNRSVVCMHERRVMFFGVEREEGSGFVLGFGFCETSRMRNLRSVEVGDAPVSALSVFIHRPSPCLHVCWCPLWCCCLLRLAICSVFLQLFISSSSFLLPFCRGGAAFFFLVPLPRLLRLACLASSKLVFREDGCFPLLPFSLCHEFRQNVP